MASDNPSIPVSRAQCRALFARLQGLPITRLHLTVHGSLFVELGELDERGETGRVTICCECQWRFDAPRSVYVGSGFPPHLRDKRLDALLGETVEQFQLDSPIPELLIDFSGKRRLRSFTVDETQPKWGIKLETEDLHRAFCDDPLNDHHPWIGVKSGRLRAEWIERQEAIMVIIPA